MEDGLERLFISYTGEDSAVPLHCSGLHGDRVFEQVVLVGRWP